MANSISSTIEAYLDYMMDHLQEKNFLYLIKTSGMNITGDWFFSDLKNEAKPFHVVWVPHQRSAFQFPSEQAVEEFRSDYLNPRQTEIIRLKHNEIT